MNLGDPKYNEAVIEFQKKVLSNNCWQSCLNCEFWAPDQPGVGQPQCQKYKAMPPPDVIVVGCPEWLNPIPF